MTFLPFVKKGDMTVIRNFEKAIVLKVKIVKKPKVAVAYITGYLGEIFGLTT